MERYKFALQLVWSICSKPDATLRYEALLNTFYGKTVFKHFVMPLVEVLLVVAFVGALFHSGFNIATSCVRVIFDCLSFVVSYGALFGLVRWITLRFVDTVADRNMSMMVGVMMSVIFVVKILQAIFPNLFFVSFFYVYVFYLVWVMSEGVVDVSEENRNKYMCFVSIVTFFVPFVVGKLLNLMVPNL